MLRYIIVDDEPIAREGLAGYARQVDFLQVVSVRESVEGLPELIAQSGADLLFLDIQLPGISGIDYLRSGSFSGPLVILTTAFPEYALEGYALNVLDYLLKPVRFERFFQAATKAQEYQSHRDGMGDYCFIRCGHTYEKIRFAEIRYIEAMENYVTIYTEEKKFMTLLPMKQLEETLPPRHFLRIHKSFIIGTRYITALENNAVLLAALRLPIGKRYRRQVMDAMLTNRLLEKTKN